MKKNALPLTFSLVFSFSLLVFSFNYTYAQLNPLRTITIAPPTIEKSFNPGDIAEGTLKVINDSDETLNFTASVRDYIVEDNHGTPKLLPPNSLTQKYSASAWIGITPEIFTIAPRQRQELNYYIQVPNDARPGGHYAAVVYQPTNTISVKGTGTGVSTQIGTLFYINVKGTINEGARILKFFANKFQEYGPITITTEIGNKGDIHIKPNGTITLTNMIGKRVDQKNLELHNIFPEKSLEYKTTLGKKLMFGAYKAKIAAISGTSTNSPLNAAITIIVFPWKLALLILLSLTALILGIMYLNKKKNGKERASEVKESAPTEIKES